MMLQDLEPLEYRCEYTKNPPVRERDYILAFDGERLLLRKDAQGLTLPRLCEVEAGDELIYLLSVSGVSFYLCPGRPAETEGLRYGSVQELRTLSPQWLAFAGVTAYHLNYWYTHNRFCGACGTEFERKDTERALVCPCCGHVKYPEIAPAIIVGITDGDRILLSKYSSGLHRRFALIAGFVEIGETLEATVRREVSEEVGLRVKNIRYYDNQPWGFSRSLLVGFFAELDGSPEITLDTTELSEAVWTRRADVPASESNISLTAKMMDAFRSGEI